MLHLTLTFAMRKNDVIYSAWSQTFEALYLTLTYIHCCFTLHVYFFNEFHALKQAEIQNRIGNSHT